MNKNFDVEPEQNELNLIDIIVICMGVVGIAILSGNLLSDVLGKAASAVTEIMLFGFVLIYLATRNVPIKLYFRLNSIKFGSIFPLLVLSIGAAIWLDEIDRLTTLIIPMPEEQYKHIVDEYVPGSMAETMLIYGGVVLIAPFVEELIFRGVIQQILERYWDITQAILFGALFFAGAHINPWWFIQLLIMSVVLGFLAWNWNSIYPSVILHAMNNLWSLVLLYLVEKDFLEHYLWHSHVSPVWLITGFGLLYFGFKTSEKFRTNN